MNILSRFFKPKAPLPSIEHPVFGQMMAVIDHGDGRYFWEMTGEINTSIGKLTGAVDAGADGPSDDQVRLWREIIENFSEYRAASNSLITETLTGFGHENKVAELQPVSFGIYDDPATDVDWDIDFELTSEGFLYTVCFKDGQPTIMHADS